MLMGVFNASINAINNNDRLKAVKQFCQDMNQDMNLICCDNFDKSGFSYTYRHAGTGVTSFLNHFFLQNNSVDAIVGLNNLDVVIICLIITQFLCL